MDLLKYQTKSGEIKDTDNDPSASIVSVPSVLSSLMEI
jgi:hypothetical protein